MVMKSLIWGVALLLLLFAGWHLFLAMRLAGIERSFGQPVAFEGLRLGSRPNQFLLAPEGVTESPSHAASPVFPVPAERLRDELLAVIRAEPRTRVLHRAADGLVFTVVQQTALMRYPDFASIEVRPVEGGSTLLVYSRSVFGHSDLGVNGKRVERWLGALRARLPAG